MAPSGILLSGKAARIARCGEWSVQEIVVMLFSEKASASAGFSVETWQFF